MPVGASVRPLVCILAKHAAQTVQQFLRMRTQLLFHGMTPRICSYTCGPLWSSIGAKASELKPRALRPGRKTHTQ